MEAKAGAEVEPKPLRSVAFVLLVEPVSSILWLKHSVFGLEFRFHHKSSHTAGIQIVSLGRVRRNGATDYLGLLSC